MTLRCTALCGLLLSLFTGIAPRQPGVPAALLPARPSATTPTARAEAAYGQRRLSFEANQGQTDDSVRYIARARGYTIFLTDADAIIRVANARRDTVRMTLAGGTLHPRIVPADRAGGTTNYLLGNDSRRWQRDVPGYAGVRYEAVYPGIDLLYYGTERELEYDFVVAPAASPRQIQLAFTGADAMAVAPDGDLLVNAGGDPLRFHKPRAYQGPASNRRPVDARYVIGADGRVGFEIGQYDTTEPLVIDPVLSYSTYLGGSGSDFAYGIAVDASGNVYVAGCTDSLDFPSTAGVYSRVYGGGDNVPPRGDVFVAKLNASGTLVYSTYIGGTSNDKALGIAVDAAGSAYLTGSTSSTNFPTTSGAFQPRWGNYPFSSNGDAFVLKLNASGSALVYSTFLSGSSLNSGNAIAVDASGNAYITGEAWYTFPTPNPLVNQSTIAFSDIFVAKLNASGSGLVYATLLGGNDLEEGYGIAVDSAGSAYIAGRTSSTNFPMKTAAQATYGGAQDVVAAKLGASGALVYSTYIGGSSGETAGGIAVDASGNAYITGGTGSTNFPTTTGAFQVTSGRFGGGDAFVTKLGPTGAFAYSTYLGGSLSENIGGGLGTSGAIAVDGSGNAFVTGATQSDDFPLKNALQIALGGAGKSDVFVTKLNATGSALLYSTYLGGASDDLGRAIAIDSAGNAYVAGRTLSTDFPTLSPVQTTNRGSSNVIIAKLDPRDPPTMALDKTSLIFGAASTGAGFTAKTGTQSVRLTQSGLGTVTWTASSTTPWLVVSPTSGTGSATLTVSVQFATGLASTQTGNITVTLNGAVNTVGPIAARLNTVTATSAAPPLGVFDTPTDGATGVTGSLPVTGWAVDDLEVSQVRILRDPVSGEPPGALVFIGNAVLVDGARPDVQASYPNVPRSSRSGWGYLMLTNFLPNLGNGTFKLTAIADDVDGHSTVLGTKTITCTNNTATTPFGSIDTPAQGEVMTGSTYNNFGWVLSPGGRKADPPDGGFVNVVVDGAIVTQPSGWTSRADLTSLFPASGFSGIGKALGVATLNIGALSNGTHTISWVVTDNLGAASGIGSRYFTVSNGTLRLGSETAEPAQQSLVTPGLQAASTLAGARGARASLRGRRGWDFDAPYSTYAADGDGVITIQSEELDRIELQLGAHATGYSRAGGGRRPLPIGSHLDPDTGTFTWQPGVGFVGGYDFVLAGRDVRIVLNPKSSGRVGPQTVIDIAEGGMLAGWAADLDSRVDTGVDTVHVWAYPVEGGDPIFLGAAQYGGPRPDVAAIYGERFLKSGYGLRVEGLAPGTYDVAVFAYSTVTGGFVPAKTVRVGVR